MRLGWLLGVGLATALAAACSGERFEQSGADAGTTGGASGAGGNTGGTGAGGGMGGTGAAPSGGSGGTNCSAPQTPCDGVCVDLQANPSHCGACGNACLTTESCVGGNCQACQNGDVESCYSGPSGTDGVGLCKAGQRACDNGAWGPCQGEVLPAASDDCATPEDDNCDGKPNDGCPLESCLAIKQADPAVTSGVQTIDPDGPGGTAPFPVFCQMGLAGGGWTRFNWVKAAYVSGEDPLGQTLDQCAPADSTCHGRIPSSANPTELLIRDITDSAYAIFQFDGSTVSNAVLGALRDKKTACLVNQAAWNPTQQSSTEPWCGTGEEGGCDSFHYSKGCNGTVGWGMMLDGDGYYCRAAFKAGATLGGCGTADYGFLNGCACANEFGELYYR